MVPSTMLAVGQVVRYPEPPVQEPEYLDGHRNFFSLTAVPGAPRLIMNRGIDHPAWVSAPEGKRRPVVLLRSNPLKAGSSKTPWRDFIDVEKGRLIYYGDHRVSTTGPLGSTRGNATLLQTAEAHRSSDTETRAAAVPLLVFRSVERNRQTKGYLEFCGVGSIERVTAIHQEDPGTGNSFPNYVFDISFMDLSTEGNRLDWHWINARRDSRLSFDEANELAPLSWRTWVKLPRLTEPTDAGQTQAVPRSPDWVWDELVLACALVHRNDWREVKHYDRRAVELSDLLQRLPLHPLDGRGNDFRNTNSVQRKTADIATAHPGYSGAKTKGGKATQQVVEAFLKQPQKMLAVADRLTEAIYSGNHNLRDSIANPDTDEDEAITVEGRLLERLHRHRERDRGLRRKKISKVLASSGSLTCEVCEFNFTKIYGEHGAGYIEVHHIVPLHEAGESQTKLSDLALLCANCHRMSHRRLEKTGTWPSPTELRDLIR